MGDLVNLNRARKAKRRADAVTRAEVNRAVFGRTKADKATAAQDAARRDALLNGAKREE